MKKIYLAIAAAFFLAFAAATFLPGCGSTQDTPKGDKKAKAPKITDTYMETYYPSGAVNFKGPIKKVDGKAIRDGQWTIFYETGEKGKAGAYKDDKFEGPWTQYSKTGKVIMTMNYKEGKMDGLVTSFYDSGAKKSDENYVQDKRHGKKISYYEDGKVYSEAEYVDGEKVDIEKTFYADGKLKSEIPYRENKKHGTARTYHKDGTTINVFSTYDAGSLNGPWYSNYSNGTKKMQGQYVPSAKTEETENKNPLMPEQVREGDKTGKWTFFHDNGKKAMEGTYVNNNQEGTWKMYEKEGYLSSEGPFVKSSQTGLWNYYTGKGGVEKKLTLSGGIPSGKGWLYDNGKLTFEGDFTGLPQKLSKNGPGKEYHPTGKVMSEGDYMMNRKTGSFKEYYSSGKLQAEGKFINDKRNDIWIFYKEDGVTKDEAKSGYYMMGTLNKAFTPGKFEFKPSFK